MALANSAARGRTRHPFLRLLRYARPYWAFVFGAVLCAVAYAGARTVRLIPLRPLIDEIAIPGEKTNLSLDDLMGALRGSAPAHRAPELPPSKGREDASHLLASVRANASALAMALALTLLVVPPAFYGQEVLAQYALGRVLVDLQRDLCAKLITLPLGFHQQQSRGETLSRVMNDTAKAHAALEQIFVEVVQSVVMLVVSLATALFLCWQLTLAMAAGAPLLGGVISWFGARIRRSADRRQQSQAEITQRLLQILSGIKVVKAFKAQEGEAQAFATENLRYFRRNLSVVKNRALSQASIEFFSNGIGVSVLLLGVGALVLGLWHLTFGTLVPFIAVMTFAYRPMKDFSKAWTRLQEAIPSAGRFFEVLDAPEEPPDPPNARSLDGVRESIRLRGISFSYGREPVLKDVSLDVRQGEMVAIVGKTGSGKTTLADLLLRLWDPDQGTIEIDGVDLRQLKRSSWLDHVAVVTQEPFLFSGTIRQNILYGRPGASEHDMLAAARAAHVDEFVDRFDAGYDTDVGEAGSSLSGGQRQRITIARAILKRPDVLIFDEATSALDAESERLVQDAIDALLAGRTTFVIAHRLSTVRHADKILVLRDGQVAELGSHDDLMAKGGTYADLMRAQEFSS